MLLLSDLDMTLIFRSDPPSWIPLRGTAATNTTGKEGLRRQLETLLPFSDPGKRSLLGDLMVT